MQFYNLAKSYMILMGMAKSLSGGSGGWGLSGNRDKRSHQLYWHYRYSNLTFKVNNIYLCEINLQQLITSFGMFALIKTPPEVAIQLRYTALYSNDGSLQYSFGRTALFQLGGFQYSFRGILHLLQHVG
jgi:hypothetical protein